MSSWNTSSHFCIWQGIVCASNSHQVQALLLASSSLYGTLSPQIGNLGQGLSHLDLSNNQLAGPLPSSLGQLKSLQYLNLSQNQLSGTLPSSLGQMKSLHYLDLSQNQLSGTLPSSFGQMKSLQHLELSYNQLSGTLPSSLGQMKSLHYFDLSLNQLSGTLPSSFGQMKSLQHLELSYSQLSGPLPSSLGQMKSLQYLDLSYNQLSGPLPSSLTSNLYFFDVSYNRLQGMIPNVYQNISLSSFVGNPGLCGPPLVTSCTSHSKRNINPHSKRNMKLYLLVLVCVAVGAVSLILASFWAWRHFFYNKRDLGSDFVVPQYKAWTAEEMRVATHDFDAANVIGSGAVSTCYVGVMKVPESGMRVVAVKRLTVDDYDEGDDEGRKSFVNEFKTLCKMRHRNLVKVLGYCVEGEEIALVMEYMEKGDLDRRLHNKATSNLNISWEERVNVALDVAEGLVYLHHEYEQPIIHCDLKPKNILLSSDMVAKISDFGIAKLLEANETGSVYKDSLNKFGSLKCFL